LTVIEILDTGYIATSGMNIRQVSLPFRTGDTYTYLSNALSPLFFPLSILRRGEVIVFSPPRIITSPFLKMEINHIDLNKFKESNHAKFQLIGKAIQDFTGEDKFPIALLLKFPT
jgi:hypothetical protein